MLFRLKKEVVLSRLGALYFGSRKRSSSSVACFLQILTTTFKKKSPVNRYVDGGDGIFLRKRIGSEAAETLRVSHGRLCIGLGQRQEIVQGPVLTL